MTEKGMNLLVEQRLDVYSEAFDYYWNMGRMPSKLEQDVLAGYIKSVLDDPVTRYRCETDSLWMGLLKESLMEFIRVLLPYYIEIEERVRREQQYMEQFFTGDIDMKRAMWCDVVEFIEGHYPPGAVNMDGYDYLLRHTDKSKDDIFDCLEQEWGDALNHTARAMQEQLIENNRKAMESTAKQLASTKDYKERKKLETTYQRYPILNEIVRKIGREKEQDNEERDEVVTNYKPLLLAHSPIRECIDGVVAGDDLAAMLPSEVALLADSRVENIFYQRYATKKLQLFSGCSPRINKEKKRVEQKCQPRLTEGPIIVSIDTSGSMSGSRERVSKALLVQLLDMAKRKGRKCFLITFSVRARTMEITHPTQWRGVRKFLEEHFTGGTDGEDMLHYALVALDKKDFSMADVLVISDFEFSMPRKVTCEAIAEAQAEGTKFYGLRLSGGCYEKKYDTLFDKMWVQKVYG